MANLPADADKALIMGLVHDVFPDESFGEDVMKFCRHLAEQNAEQMGTAKIAIELAHDVGLAQARQVERSEEHTSELQSLMRISYAVFCLKKKNNITPTNHQQ